MKIQSYSPLSSLFHPKSRFFLDPFNLKFEEENFIPEINIIETKESYKVEANLAGIPKEDIRISLENEQLCIAGERKAKKEEKGETYHHIESSFGKFKRLFSLPNNVDATKIEAEVNNGILAVILPKIDKTQLNNKTQIIIK